MMLRSRQTLVDCLDGLQISERELARRAGLSHSTVNHLSTGRRTTCTAQSAIDIERALGVTSGTLFIPLGDLDRQALIEAMRGYGRRRRSIVVLRG